MLIMCAVRSADGRCTTAPPTLPRRTEIRPSVSRMWIASRSAGGLTPNSVNRLSCDGRTSPSLSRPDRMSSRSREATISATRGWRIRRCGHGSDLPPVAEPVGRQALRRQCEGTGLADAQHLVVESQAGGRRRSRARRESVRCRTEARCPAASACGRRRSATASCPTPRQHSSGAGSRSRRRPRGTRRGPGRAVLRRRPGT